MLITVQDGDEHADPREHKYYRANVSPMFAKKHDNGCLASIGWIVGKDLPRASFNFLHRRGRLAEITYDQWRHSSCQSSCILRGDRRCSW